MEQMMIFTEAQITALLAQRSITNKWPWSTNDEATIDGNIRNIIAKVRQDVSLLDKTEYGHYGSGYSSYVDCWLYREGMNFQFSTGNYYWGLVVLFSRLSNYYVIGEGQKTWSEKGGSSYLPAFEFVDQVRQPATLSILDDVCAVLNSQGLVRLYAAELSRVLSDEIQVPTILEDPPWRDFDAIFYWED